MVAGLLYYSLSSLFQPHFAGLDKQITAVLGSCIILWVYALLQLEGTLNRPSKKAMAYLGVALVAGALMIIQIPAWSHLGAIHVMRPGYDPTRPPTIGIPTKPRHPHLKPSALSKEMGSMIRKAMTWLLAVGGLVILAILLLKRRHTAETDNDVGEPKNVLNLVKRESLSGKKHAFLHSDDAVRRRVQVWLSKLLRKPGAVKQWQTVREIEQEQPNDDIAKLLQAYDRARYGHTEEDPERR